MKSKKLSKYEKENFSKIIIKQKIDPQTKELDMEVEKEFFLFYNEYMLKHRVHIDKLPENFFIHLKSVHIQFGNTWHESLNLHLENEILFPDNFIEHRRAEIKPKNLPKNFIKKFKSLYEKKQEITKYESELKTELNKLFGACNTTKQLLEAFPEIEKYMTLEERPFYPLVANTKKLKQLLNQ